MVINSNFNRLIQYWSTNTSLEHKHIGAQTRLRTRRAFLNLGCMFSVQPQLAAPMGPSAHSTWGYQPHDNFSNPVLPTAYVFGFQNGYQATYGIQNNSYLGPWQAPCLSFCTVRCNLQHYQHNDGYQQCLGKVQKHIQGHDCIKAMQFGIQCQCSGLTHTVHILVFGKGLQSTS